MNNTKRNLGMGLAGMRLWRGAPPSSSRLRSGFTLIEILVVCGIIGIVMSMSIPMIYHKLYPDSMQKVSTDLLEACSHARAYAILQGTPVDLVINAEDGQITLQPASAARAATPGEVDSPSVSGGKWRMEDRNRLSSPDVSGQEWRGEERPASTASDAPLSFSSRIPEKIAVELVEVNFQDAMEWAEVRVRFYPNGTSDEFKLLLYRPDTNERRLITLEVVTALADMESDMMRMKLR